MKNLIYTVFFGEPHILDQYLLMSELLLRHIDHNNTDFLVVTENKFLPSVKQNKNAKPFMYTKPHENIQDITWARFEFLDLIDLSNYSKVLYLDVDIVISCDLAQVFELEMNKPIYSYNDGFNGNLKFDMTKNCDFYGYSFLANEKLLDKLGNSNVFSTGVMLFNTEHMHTIRKSFLFAKKILRKCNVDCYVDFYSIDQPAINIALTMLDTVNPNGLNSFVVNNPEKQVKPISHFPGGIGNTNKIKKMTDFIEIQL